MSDVEKTKAAVDAVARRLVYNAYHGGRQDWEDFPEIGEHDWSDVTTRAFRIVEALQVSDDAFTEAYKYLSDRAEQV